MSDRSWGAYLSHLNEKGYSPAALGNARALLEVLDPADAPAIVPHEDRLHLAWHTDRHLLEIDCSVSGGVEWFFRDKVAGATSFGEGRTIAALVLEIRERVELLGGTPRTPGRRRL